MDSFCFTSSCCAAAIEFEVSSSHGVTRTGDNHIFNHQFEMKLIDKMDRGEESAVEQLIELFVRYEIRVVLYIPT